MTRMLREQKWTVQVHGQAWACARRGRALAGCGDAPCSLHPTLLPGVSRDLVPRSLRWLLSRAASRGGARTSSEPRALVGRRRCWLLMLFRSVDFARSRGPRPHLSCPSCQSVPLTSSDAGSVPSTLCTSPGLSHPRPCAEAGGSLARCLTSWVTQHRRLTRADTPRDAVRSSRGRVGRPPACLSAPEDSLTGSCHSAHRQAPAGHQPRARRLWGCTEHSTWLGRISCSQGPAGHLEPKSQVVQRDCRLCRVGCKPALVQLVSRGRGSHRAVTGERDGADIGHASRAPE